MDLGPILNGFGRYYCVFLTLFFRFFGSSFSIAFYMGYVWNVHGICIRYRWKLYYFSFLCQFSLE